MLNNKIYTCLSLKEVATILKEFCPYISATENTWLAYARSSSDWMDASDIILLEDKILMRYEIGTQIRDRSMTWNKRRSLGFPVIQYSPIETTLARIVEAIKLEKPIDWSEIARSTISKSLYALEVLGFLNRKTQLLNVAPDAIIFIENSPDRPRLFAERALKIEPFKLFIEILNENENEVCTIKDLGTKLKRRLSANWVESTANTNAKILMDWAKHTKLAPKSYLKNRQGRKKTKEQPHNL